jgi:hypothetical protein
MKNTVQAIVIAMLVGTSGSSFAFNYSPDYPLAFTYQNDRGYWFGCGNLQCLQSGEGSSQDVLRKVEGYGVSLSRSGDYGDCRMYEGDEPTPSKYRSSSRVAELAQKYCNR